jgi:hypothetical protein
MVQLFHLVTVWQFNYYLRRYFGGGKGLLRLFNLGVEVSQQTMGSEVE